MADRAVGAVWADYSGRTRLTIIKALVNPCTILNDVQHVSNAEVLYNWDGPIDTTIGTTTQAQYQAANQSATLTFITAGNTELHVRIPAPQVGIFLADQKTVDASNAAVAALIAACIGQLTDGAGHVAVAYLSGSLDRSANDLTPIG